MKKFINLLILIVVAFFCPAFGQDSAKIIRDSSQPCLLTKATLSMTSSLKLGSYLYELKKEYPELSLKEGSPFPNTTAYLTDSPFSNISHLLLVFSSENKLVSFTLISSSKEWTSIEEPFIQATTALKLKVSKNSLTVWREGERETITVGCKDFALISTLNPLKNGQTNEAKMKRFSFTVSDSSVMDSSTEKTQPNSQKRQSVPQNTVDINSKVFPQDNSEYTIEFPQKPTIRTVQSESGSVEQADLVSSDYTILRAEYGVATTEQISVINNSSKEKLNQVGIEIGKMIGYTGVTVTSGKTNLGTYIKLRGYKTINDTSYLIEHLMFYGKYSIMTVVTGAKATDYPTQNSNNFIKSLKRKFE